MIVHILLSLLVVSWICFLEETAIKIGQGFGKISLKGTLHVIFQRRNGIGPQIFDPF